MEAKYPHFVFKDHGDMAIHQENFNELIDDLLHRIEDYLGQTKNNKTHLKMRLWKEFYGGDGVVEYLAEELGVSKKTIYFHLYSVTSILKRLPEAKPIWREI